MAAFLKKLFPFANLKDTALRFPLSTLCSVALFAMILLITHDVLEEDDQTILKIMFLLSGGFFWFGVAKLIAESRALSAGRHLILALTGFAGLGAIIFTHGEWNAYALFLMPSFLLLVMVAPYTKDSDDLSFWFFNRVTWFGAAMGVLASIIWAGGLSAALASIDFLFDVNIDEKVYGDLWAFSCTIFGPLYALSWVPQKFFFREEDCNDPPGLAFMLNWVFAPLTLIYMLILYAYLLKIISIHSMPSGQLAYMITGFGGVGVATYLMGWPLRQRGGAILRFVHSWFFPAMIIPVIMQALAAWMRIEQYGLTEQRYAICVTVLWFAVISLLYAHKQFPLKFIPGILAVLLILSSFGPWGATGLSGISQFSRLETLLVKNNILQNAQIVKVEKADSIPLEDRKSISSILDYLNNTKHTDRLRPWFEGPGETWMFTSTSEVTREMGFEYVSSWTPDYEEGFFNFNAPPNENAMVVSGFDYVVGPVYPYISRTQEWTQSWAAQQDTGLPKIDIKIDKGILTVDVAGTNVEFDIEAYAQEQFKVNPTMTQRPMQLEKQNGKLKIRLVLQSLHGQMDGEKAKVNSMNFLMLVRTGG